MIFEDPSRKRWKITLLVFITTMVVAIFLLSLWIASIVINPPLSSVQAKKQNQRMAVKISHELETSDGASTVLPHADHQPTAVVKHFIAVTTSTIGDIGSLYPGKLLSTAFLVQADPDSLRSYREHASAVDIVFPDWYTVTANACNVNEHENKSITAVINGSRHSLIFPRLSNGKDGVWYSEEWSNLLRSDETRHCLVTTIAELLKKTGAPGINVDIEALASTDKDAYLEFLVDLTTVLHAQHQLVTVDVPARDPAFDMEYIGQVADAVVLMAYDEHYPDSEPGPIVSRSWFRDTLQDALTAIPPQKLILAMGAYGYDWTLNTTTPAQSLKFDELMALAEDTYAQPELSLPSRNMYFGYQDAQGLLHQVWFLNGITAWNQWVRARQFHLAGVSLWRLGTEDPSVWQLFEKADVTGVDFKTAPPLKTIHFASQGELFKIKTFPRAGTLDLTFDQQSIDYAQYSTLPSGYVLERVGEELPPKSLLLTFDDGPSEQWTPHVLDVLDHFHVPAIFFVVGDQAQKNPELLKAMADRGYLIGNHTYLHPDISSISQRRLQLELNQTQRVIESSFGKKTILFRAPYDTDTTPSTLEQLKSLAEVSRLGYIIMGANVDSDDWQRPGVDAIVKHVEAQLSDPTNHVIVLHDAGGDRSQTVAALQILIPDLQAKGYTFVSLPAATHLSHNYFNPLLDSKEWIFVQITLFISWFMRWGWILIVWLFFLTTVISIVRIIFLGSLVVRSLFQAKNRPKQSTADWQPFISVVIPAYNEEKTIERTLHHVQNGSYTNLEIIVIDDGSTDETVAVVKKMEATDDRLHLIRQPNSGKAAALNNGFKVSIINLEVQL